MIRRVFIFFKTYEAIMKWVKHDESDREHLLPELLSSIKLTSIPQNYFDQKIATEPLIKSNPKCKISIFFFFLWRQLKL